jgi:hypothetical protein
MISSLFVRVNKGVNIVNLRKYPHNFHRKSTESAQKHRIWYREIMDVKLLSGDLNVQEEFMLWR